jgi:hypothetical protein
LFPEGSAPKTSVPFPRAGRRKDVKDYEPEAVTKALSAPPQLEAHDPRTLKASQPSVTRAGVAHYMGPEYERNPEATFADREQAGNRYPIVYHRKQAPGASTQERVILSGHHRATAALLKGEPLKAIRVEGGWGPPRR